MYPYVQSWRSRIWNLTPLLIILKLVLRTCATWIHISALNTSSHRIMEYPELDGTHKDQVQLLALHRTTQRSNHMSESIVRLVPMIASLENLFQCLTIFLVKNLFYNIQPEPPLMQLHGIIHAYMCDIICIYIYVYNVYLWSEIEIWGYYCILALQSRQEKMLVVYTL